MEVAKLEAVLTADIKPLQAGLNAAGNEVQKFAVKSEAAVKKTTTNFTGLSRVIQDLPFGFIAISNNLTQILPAAGALGLVVSAVTTAITFLQVGLRNWTGRTKENTTAQKEHTQAVNKDVEAAASEFAAVSKLVVALQDQSKSLDERKKSLNELRTINGSYFGDLKIEHGFITGLTDAYAAYENKILAVAKAKGAASQIESLSKELISIKEQTFGIESVFTNVNLTFKQLAELLKGQDLSNGFTAIQNAAQKVNDILKQEVPTLEQIEFLSKISGVSIAEINEMLRQRGKLHTTEAKLLAQIASLSAFINTNDAKGVALTEEKSKKIKEEMSLEELLLRFREFVKRKFGEEPIKAPVEFVIGEAPTLLSDIEAKIAVEHMRDVLRASGKQVFSNQGILSGVELLNDDEVDDNFKKILKETALIINAADQLGSAFSNVFETILTEGKLSFKAVENALASMISKLAAAVVEAALLSLILNALGLGGAIEGGASFKNILKGLIGLADGGVVTSPTLAMVGESGPEAVIPLSQLQAMTSGMSNVQRVEVVGRISGNDIVLIQNRQNVRNGRNYGGNFAG